MLLAALAVAAVPSPIPAGTFTQGSGRAPDEPLRAVTLSAYRIDRAEVTVADYERFAATAWSRREVWSEEGWAWAQAHPGGAGPDARAAGREVTHPVVAVSWYEADAYCRAQGAFLPTEAQWEHAACGDGGRMWPWGDEPRAGVAWFHDKAGELSGVATLPAWRDEASTGAPNRLLHMAGNVWEWTADWYERDLSDAPATDPRGPAEGTWKTLKGGSYANLPSYCACAHREPARPERVSLTVGFRCAWSP